MRDIRIQTILKFTRKQTGYFIMTPSTRSTVEIFIISSQKFGDLEDANAVAILLQAFLMFQMLNVILEPNHRPLFDLSLPLSRWS